MYVFKRDRACLSSASKDGIFFFCPFFLNRGSRILKFLYFFHIFFVFVFLGVDHQKSSSVYHQKQKSHISQVFFSTTKNDQWSSQLGSIFRRRDEPEIKKKKV